MAPGETNTADEFAFLPEAAAEVGLPVGMVPQVVRQAVHVAQDQEVSVLRWGSTSAEVVFLHGGGQNAHTWDVVALLLNRAVIAIDLPGHGHSTWRADRNYGPAANAAAITSVVEQLAPEARGVVGMSLGGLTAIRLASARPDLVRRVVLVDVTPGSARATQEMSTSQRGAVELTRGPRTFGTREEMIQAATAASPRRLPNAVRRGVIHNSRRLPDGSWGWRYDSLDPATTEVEAESLWEELGRLQVPMMLVRGGESAFVTEGDLARTTNVAPSVCVEVVPQAGHAVQSDQPLALSRLIRDFLFPAA